MSVFSSWEPVNVTFDGKGALSDIIKLRILRREDRPGLSKAGVLNQVASVLKTDIQRTWGRDHGGHAKTLRGVAAALLGFGFQSPKLSVITVLFSLIKHVCIIQAPPEMAFPPSTCSCTHKMRSLILRDRCFVKLTPFRHSWNHQSML